MVAQIASRQLFIGGQWQHPVRGERIPVVDPATEAVVGDIPAATAEDVELAVKAARIAFTKDNGKHWARSSGKYRAKFLRAVSSKIIEQKIKLAELEALDCGKPLDESMWDMDDVAACFAYYADLAESLDTENYAEVEVPLETFKSYVLKEPLGVVGLITPWFVQSALEERCRMNLWDDGTYRVNYPLLMAAWKVAPALAAGCTAVLKPSELSSVTCLELASICEEIGLPCWCFKCGYGVGPAAGAPLASHPDIAKLAFTGSSATGQKIMSAAAENIKPVTLELGGKSPIIVFDDADIDKAVEWTMFGAFWTNGQICSATSRLLVQETIAAEFTNRLVEWTKSIKVSNPLEKDCRLGPIVSEGQYKKVLKHIAQAQAEGATLLCGGRRPRNLEKGYFVEATVLGNVTPQMQIWKEEVFGPVLTVTPFKTEDEAIQLANDSQYGLAGAVISKDNERCKRVSEALQAGIVWINCSQPVFVQAPWGGSKRSGFGRELGKWGLENYLNVKQVTKYISEDAWGWYPAPSRM